MSTAPHESTQAVRGIRLLDNYIAGFRHRLAHRKLIGLDRRQRILDIGCGHNPLFLISSDFKEKFGVEKNLSPAARQLAAQHNLTLQEMDLETDPMPFETNFFDAIICLAVIEHLRPSTTGFFLNEIHRVLRPGGRLILTTPAAWTDGLLRTMAAAHIISKEEIDDHKDTFTPPKVRRQIERAGFRSDQVRCGLFELGMNIWATAEKALAASVTANCASAPSSLNTAADRDELPPSSQKDIDS